jgi:hypothetical protein
MKPVKIDQYKCGNCGNIENVFAGKTPNMMTIIVVGNEHQWCPDCVYKIESWRIHVDEENLTRTSTDKKKDALELKDLIDGMEKRLKKHSKPMQHLNLETGQITKFPQNAG